MRPPLRIALALLSLTRVAALRAADSGNPAFDEHVDVTIPAEIFERAAWGAVPVFFPPEPPAFATMEATLVRRGEPYSTHTPLSPPPELAAYIGEPFYPALGTRLAMREVGRGSQQRLAEYRAEKLKLQSELRAELVRWRDAPVGVRQTQLTAFAREQTPRIAALERKAEGLRQSFTKLDYRWGANRNDLSALGHDKHNPESAEEIADVMRAAAFYEGGLLPAQRRFLREIALELPLAAHTLQDAVNAQPEDFFSPGLARVRWPADLPPELTRKIATYQARRSALKKEVYDVVFRTDRTWFAIVRAMERHFNLETQATALDELETLAEEIRCGLAALPSGERRTSCPPDLMQRLRGMLDRQRALCRDARETIEATRAREKLLEINYAVGPGSLQYTVAVRGSFFRAERTEGAARRKIVEADFKQLAAAHRTAFVALELERNRVATALGHALLLDDPRDIESALLAATREAFEQENDGPYHCYRAAVFEPGLSPEQRRLLLDAACEQLLLPLPPGAFQPQ